MGAILKVIGVLGIVGVVAVVGGAVFMVTVGCQTPPMAKEMRPVQITPAAAASFDSKMKSLEDRFNARQKGEDRLTEQEVSSKAATQSLPFKGVQINFVGQGQKSRATATWSYQGISCPFAVEALARVEGGRIRVNIQTLQMGLVGVPGFVADQLQGLILAEAGKVNIPNWMQDANVTGDGTITVRTK